MLWFWREREERGEDPLLVIIWNSKLVSYGFALLNFYFSGDKKKALKLAKS